MVILCALPLIWCLIWQVDGDDEAAWALGDERLRAIVERAERSARAAAADTSADAAGDTADAAEAAGGAGDWRSMMASDGWSEADFDDAAKEEEEEEDEEEDAKLDDVFG
jgi:hypothetical protein